VLHVLVVVPLVKEEVLLAGHQCEGSTGHATLLE